MDWTVSRFEMKSCFKCGAEKPLTDFYTHSRMKDGHLNKCKSCTKRDVSLNNPDNPYDRTEKGVVRVIYKTQKRNNAARGFGSLPFTKNGTLGGWYVNGFKELYDSWVSSGYMSCYKPSVDRIDSLSGYSFYNMRLVTWEENRKAQAEDILNATGSGGRRCKPVYKVDENGVVVGEYISLSEARRVEGFEIWNLLARKNRDRNGCYWFYK